MKDEERMCGLYLRVSTETKPKKDLVYLNKRND